MDETYVYSLDLSLNSTGVCIFSNDGIFARKLTIDTHSEKETKLKLKMIGSKMLELMSEFKPGTVIIEQGFSLHNKSTQALFRVHGLINYIFSDYDQIYYPASTVKKVVGGKGNTKKDEIMRAVIERCPDLTFENYDESDAYALALTYFYEKGILHA